MKLSGSISILSNEEGSQAIKIQIIVCFTTSIYQTTFTTKIMHEFGLKIPNWVLCELA